MVFPGGATARLWVSAFDFPGNSVTHRLQEYRGYVWLAYDADENYYVAKAIEKGSLEIKALQTMLSLPSPRNRVIPGRLFECETSYVYLMPRLERMGAGIWAPSITWDTMLDHLYAIIDVSLMSDLTTSSTQRLICVRCSTYILCKHATYPS